MWVLRGALDHKISLKRLFTVMGYYEKIGLVPEGYMQAELYRHDKPPEHMAELTERISLHK